MAGLGLELTTPGFTVRLTGDCDSVPDIHTDIKQRFLRKVTEAVYVIVFFLPVPDKALLEGDFQIFGWTKSEFLFADIE